MKNSVLFVFLCFIHLSLFGQDTELKNYDHIYKDNIKSVKFHLGNVVLSYPMADLRRSGLTLSFDDMNEEVVDYVYTIIHCNKDWTPSDLDELDYLDGFNGEDIENYDYSFNTLTDYTHYRLPIPNRDARLLVSGNYLIHVFEDEDELEPVITRRFMLNENLMRITPDVVPASIVSKFKTHQEIDFSVNFKGIEIANAQRDITAYVLQNGRWDNAVKDLKPLFTKQEDLLFDYQNKVIFPALKEFRFLDIRTFRYTRDGIADIIRGDKYWDVVTKKEGSRANRNFNSYNDINGNFVIEHLEDNRPNLEGDYAKVLFALGVGQELQDTDVYLMGAMTDWQLKEEFKMAYSPAVSSYVVQPLLKQGFYNYMYVTVPSGEKEWDNEEFEGNWHQTENTYSILVYYRPFGERYDRLVAVRTFNSVNY